MKERRRIWIPEAPAINLRRYREVGVVGHRIGVEGWFEVELVHARTGLVKRSLSFRNLVTDDGLNTMADDTAIQDLLTHLAVGTGSSAPDVSQSSLDAEVSRTSSTGGFSDASGFSGAGDSLEYVWVRRTRVFSESQANGNLAELGMFSSGGVMFCRQLFRDELGNPTTITKTNEDQLRVRYTWRVYPPMDDSFDEITVTGQPTTVRSRVAAVIRGSQGWDVNAGRYLGSVNATGYNVYSGPIGGRSGVPSNPLGTGQGQLHAYDPGSFCRDFTWTWQPSVANGTIRSFGRNSTANNHAVAFQAEFDPPFVKTDSERLIIHNRYVYSRYEP